MFVASPRSAGRIAVAARRQALAVWLCPAALIAAALTGCSGGGEYRDALSEAKTIFRLRCAAEKAYLHRGDLFHNCCSSPLDFKQGFIAGYKDVGLYGDDCCAPPTPPKCYWGCEGLDPCGRVELMNCYYDGWAHGAIAAGQDGVVAVNAVPLRNICGGYQPGGPSNGPLPGAPPAPGMPFPGGNFPPLPPGLSFDPEPPRNDPEEVPAPAPIPLNLPENQSVPSGDAIEGGPADGMPSEGSVGGPADVPGSLSTPETPGTNGSGSLIPPSAPPFIEPPVGEPATEPSAPQISPPAEAGPAFPGFDLDGAGDGASVFPNVPGTTNEGPKVTTLWGDGF